MTTIKHLSGKNSSTKIAKKEGHQRDADFKRVLRNWVLMLPQVYCSTGSSKRVFLGLVF
jgi:hypothetical protein